MVLYAEVGEESKEQNKKDWVGEKREVSAKVQVELTGKNAKIQKRKDEFDAIKKKEGSVVELLTAESDKHGGKILRPTPSCPSIEDDPKRFIGQRIAKYFEMPDPDNNNRKTQSIYFGSIDKICNESNSLWHIQVSKCRKNRIADEKATMNAHSTVSCCLPA